MHLNLELDHCHISNHLAEKIHLGKLDIVSTLEKIICQMLADCLYRALGSRLIKPPKVEISTLCSKNRFFNLTTLRKFGYQCWYPTIKFSTLDKDEVEITGLNAFGFESRLKGYNYNEINSFKFNKKQLKRQTNHLITLSEFLLPQSLFGETIDLLNHIGHPQQPFIANLRRGVENKGFRLVSFDHAVTGKQVYCSCHKGAHQRMIVRAQAIRHSYIEEGWPHKVVKELEKADYKDNMCHFCIANTCGKEAITGWYGPAIKEIYEPYVDVLVNRDGLDERTALAETKNRLSLSRWINEDKLFLLIKELFPKYTIQREVSPDWLGRQRLDIFLPEISLALEFQGQQHYMPVNFFGGDSALAKNKERDERKRQLCKQNGVTVIDIRYDYDLSLSNLKFRLRKWLLAQENGLASTPINNGHNRGNNKRPTAW